MFLITCALEQESRGRFEKLPDCHILYTGLGKINATMSLTKFLTLYKDAATNTPPGKVDPKYYLKYVINLGTVGSGSYYPGTVVQVSHFIQRDMLAYPLAPYYCTPFDPHPGAIKCATIPDFLPTASCGTGDSFVSKSHFYDNLVDPLADMEGYALAKVCRSFNIPFISLKYVTDSGEAESWENRLEAASIALHQKAARLLKILNNIPIPTK